MYFFTAMPWPLQRQVSLVLCSEKFPSPWDCMKDTWLEALALFWSSRPHQEKRLALKDMLLRTEDNDDSQSQREASLWIAQRWHWVLWTLVLRGTLLTSCCPGVEEHLWVATYLDSENDLAECFYHCLLLIQRSSESFPHAEGQRKIT